MALQGDLSVTVYCLCVGQSLLMLFLFFFFFQVAYAVKRAFTLDYSYFTWGLYFTCSVY